jgi:hypothetical protein
VAVIAHLAGVETALDQVRRLGLDGLAWPRLRQ